MGKEVLGSDTDIKFYSSNYDCCPPPWTMPLISMIQICIFIFLKASLSSSFIYKCSDPESRDQIWRWFTYSLIHVNCYHLIINVLIQVMIGIPLEMVHGNNRILLIYSVGVVSGPLLTTVFDDNEGISLVGGSGGAYALFTAQLVNTAKNYSYLKLPFIRLIFLLAIASVEVGYGIYRRYAPLPTGGSSIRSSYVGHLSGASMGLIIGLVVLRNFQQRLREQIYWWISIAIMTFIVFVILIYQYFNAKVLMSWNYVLVL